MSASRPPPLQAKLKELPLLPGVYLIRDASGEVIYVGKARRLRERVRSHFQAYHQRSDPKAFRIAHLAADVEVIVTDSEVEALVLEDQLVKSYRPRYNVHLKDDKRFPYLKVTMAERYPRLLISRRVERDGARYFGPYTNAQLMRETVNTLRRLFPIRTCDDDIQGRPTRRRPCLDYFIRQCEAPCARRVAPQPYRETAQKLCRFLEGRHRELLAQLRREMDEASEGLQYERAAHLRDRLTALEGLVGRESAVPICTLADRDALGLARDGDLCAVQVFFVREGAIKGREHFFLDAPAGSSTGEVLAAFVQRFYSESAVIPGEILLPEPLEDEDAELIGRWLSERSGRKVTLRVPRRGPKHNLVRLAARNAELALFERGTQAQTPVQHRGQGALAELQAALGLPRPPERIECYDVSNIQGTDAVGAMVVFEGGLPRKSEYRRFKIRGVRGPDDPAMLAEMLQRRFIRGLRERRALDRDRDRDRVPERGGEQAESAMKFARFPDLIVIDGGKGQLSAARQVLEALELGDLPAVALAKRREEVFLPGRSKPLRLVRESQALRLLQRLRDEAHRFSLSYHRRLRRRRTVQSALDEVPGVGPKRKAALLKHFGSLDKVKGASLEALQAVPGIPQAVARRVFAALHCTSGPDRPSVDPP